MADPTCPYCKRKLKKVNKAIDVANVRARHIKKGDMVPVFDLVYAEAYVCSCGFVQPISDIGVNWRDAHTFKCSLCNYMSGTKGHNIFVGYVTLKGLLEESLFQVSYDEGITCKRCNAVFLQSKIEAGGKISKSEAKCPTCRTVMLEKEIVDVGDLSFISISKKKPRKIADITYDYAAWCNSCNFIIPLARTRKTKEYVKKHRESNPPGFSEYCPLCVTEEEGYELVGVQDIDFADLRYYRNPEVGLFDVTYDFASVCTNPNCGAIFLRYINRK